MQRQPVTDTGSVTDTCGFSNSTDICYDNFRMGLPGDDVKLAVRVKTIANRDRYRNTTRRCFHSSLIDAEVARHGAHNMRQQEGQHPLTGQRAASFRRDLETT